MDLIYINVDPDDGKSCIRCVMLTTNAAEEAPCFFVCVITVRTTKYYDLTVT